MADISDSDEHIAAMVQNGQGEAFGLLIERYESKLGRYIRKFLVSTEDRQDLLQEVFLKAYANIQSFDTDKRFSPWLYRIAHNECVNFLKKKKFQPFSVFDADILFPNLASEEKSDTFTNDEYIKKSIDSVLEEIDYKYREVLLLYFYEDMSYKDISNILKIPVSSVGVRIRRGKEQVLRLLQAKGIDMI